jgi:hypothetical protein
VVIGRLVVWLVCLPEDTASEPYRVGG